MTPVLSRVSQVGAQRVVRFLSFHHMAANIKEDTSTTADARFEVCVEEADLEDTREIVELLVKDLAPGEEIPEVQSEEEAEEKPLSSVSCPHCGSRAVTYPDDPSLGLLMLLLVSVLLAGIPLLVWFLGVRVKGSLKRCTDCRHTWRSKP